MREEYVEAVLEIVARIPAARVLAYGDIAELLGVGGPRQVGSVMSRYGSSVPWWRVLRSNGEPPQCHEGTALEHYAAEATPLSALTSAGAMRRVDMRAARWRPTDSEMVTIEAIAAKLSDPGDEVEV